MLKFNTPDGTGHIENAWGELNPAQFVEVTHLTNLFFAQKFDIDEYRLRLLETLTGYKRKKRGNKAADQINENLYLIAEQLTFTINPVIGPPEILDFFSTSLRELLKTRFPWEIYEPEYVGQLLTVKDMLTVGYGLNMNLGKNLLPQVQTGKIGSFPNVVLTGPRFDTTDGDIETNLSAEQYLDASEYFNTYSATRKTKYLDAFIGCLYQPAKNTDLENEGCSFPSWGEMSEGQRGSIPNLSNKKTKDAIVLLFMFIQQTFLNDPLFKVLFSSAETAGGTVAKLNLGASEAIYQVVEQGYGSLEEVKAMNIRDFFNTQVMILKKNVAQLRALDKKPGEIARTMNLDIEIVTQL